jgi:hypothetical protein
VGDFNGDGTPDLAVANYYDDSVSILLADDSGSFDPQTTYAVGDGPTSVAVGDFNGDGTLDLAITTPIEDNTIWILLRDDGGGFNPPNPYDVGGDVGLWTIAVADFNGDCKPDLATGGSWINRVFILLNTTPVVSIAPGTDAAEAGPTDGTIAITLDEPAPAGGLTVNFNVAGSTATDPDDYSLSAGTNITEVTATTFTVAAGVTTATLNVVPEDDSEIETGGETVNVSLETGSDYILSATDNTAAVTITDNDFSEIDVEESDTSIPDAGSFDFGTTVQDSNLVKTFTITNTGNADLTLGDATLTGTGYSFVGAFPTANLAAGSSTTFQIQLDTSSEGTFNGNLSFVNGDSDENPYNFSLTGEVTAPEIEVKDGTTEIADGTTTILDWGSTPMGTALSKILTIANTGSADLNLSNLTLPTGFSIVGTLPSIIAAGSAATLEIQLDATTAGSFDGTLSFESNDADEDLFDFAIGGEVTDAGESEGDDTTGEGDDTTSEDDTTGAGDDTTGEGDDTTGEGDDTTGEDDTTGAGDDTTGEDDTTGAGDDTTGAGDTTGEDDTTGEGVDDTSDGTVVPATVTGERRAIAPDTPYCPTLPLELPLETDSTSEVPESPSVALNCACPPIPQPPPVSFGNPSPPSSSNLGNDLVIGTDRNNYFLGGPGHDFLQGLGGSDIFLGGNGSPIPVGSLGDRDLIHANRGNDILQGCEGNDTLCGGKDNDIAHGGKDDDCIWGDLGSDTLMGDLGNDSLWGGTSNPDVRDVSGEDLLFGGAGDDFLNGDGGNDSLSGGEGNDTLRGAENDDLIQSNSGDDLLMGDEGNDRLCGSDGNDTIFGGLGSDRPIGSVGEKDVLGGGAGDDFLNGNEGEDRLCGGDGNDTLHGGKDNDVVGGGDGDDLLWGDLGDDTLIGGEGNDRFVLQAGAGTDTIADFVSGTDAIALAGGLTFAQLDLSETGTVTLIQFQDEVLATLIGVVNLSAADFTLIETSDSF